MRMKRRNDEPLTLILKEIQRIYMSIFHLTEQRGLEIKVVPYETRNNGPGAKNMGIHEQLACKAEYKCSNCAQNHSTHFCEKPKTLPAKCANCRGPHLENYRYYSENSARKRQQSAPDRLETNCANRRNTTFAQQTAKNLPGKNKAT